MNPLKFWLANKPLADANLPTWIAAIRAEGLKEAAAEIGKHKDQSACDSCNRFLAELQVRLGKRVGEMEK